MVRGTKCKRREESAVSTDMNQVERAQYFRELHKRRPLILPNAWDAGSARVIELAGAPVIATTSAGVSWAHGRSDGQKLRRDEMLGAIQRIVQTVSVPVNADIEGGYATGSVKDVAETVKMMVSIGVAGINLEDSPGRDGQTLLTPEEHAERIRAARLAASQAGGDLVINARTDVYLMGVGETKGRLREVAQRAKLYLSAGADCVFVPGVIDAKTIADLVKTIEGPLNIMAMPGAPSAPLLGELGVARVSLGPAVAQAAFAAAQRAAREFLEQGTYGALEAGLSFGDINGMFTRFSA
jgi:2-methylisocitrate lyase-like PEP mutase family enzyme